MKTSEGSPCTHILELSLSAAAHESRCCDVALELFPWKERLVEAVSKPRAQQNENIKKTAWANRCQVFAALGQAVTAEGVGDERRRRRRQGRR